MIELQTETDLFGEDLAGSAKLDRAMLTMSLYANLKDISVEDFVSYLTNKFEAIVDYANLCVGAKTGQRISLLFNPHRLDTGTKRFPISLYARLKDERWHSNLARVVILSNDKTRDVLYASIGIGVGGTSFVQEFPPHVARSLALEYGLSKSSRVLDPCAGWGGRMIGFSTVIDSYTCCEPSTRTAAGLRNLYDWLRTFRNDFSATIHETPFEDVNLPTASFDFAFTSPPYFDTEWYAPGEATNSFNRYATFDAWCAGFYAPLIHRTMAALKPGAAFVINIGSRTYPLNDRLFAIAEGKYGVEKQKGKLSASNGLGKEGEGETFYEIRNPSGVVHVVTPSIIIDELAGVMPDAILAVAPVTRAKPSALNFALKQRQPDVESSISETLSSFDPVSFKAELALKGHRLLTKDGKFFVSEASLLTDEERATIKQHRDALVKLAVPWVDPADSMPTINEPTSDGQTLAQFLGSDTVRTDAARVDAGWTPDEPPDLTGIDEVILNFATTGLNWAGGDRPCGVTVASLDGSLCRFLPFGFAYGGNLDEAAVKEWARVHLRGKKILNANTKFDVHHAREWGVDLQEQGCTFSDIMHTAALLDDHRKRFALDLLIEDYLPGEPRTMRVDETKHSEHHASEVAAREIYTAQSVGRLRDVMYPEIDRQDLRAVQALEDRVIPAVVEMEMNGAPIDVELLERYGRECNQKHDALLWEIAREVGFAFAHTAKDWQRLFEALHLPPTDGNSEAIVKEIDHPIVKKAHLSAQYASLSSKVFNAYPKLITDGILHYSINQLRGEDGGTVTGRFSASPIQQCPNHDNHVAVFGEDFFPRRLYIPGAGQYLAADAAQIQYRIFASHAANPRILKMYADDPKASFHRMIEGMIRPYKQDLVYSHVKNMNFMRIFGGGIVKLAVMMGFITDAVGEEIRRNKGQRTDPRLAQAREIDAIYQREIPEVEPLLRKASHLAMTKCNEWCRKNDQLHRELPHRGYVKTVLGRRSRFPDDYRLHKAFCMVDQGSEGDILKAKIADLHEARKQTGFVMRMTVHDEVSGDALEPDTLQKVDAVLNAQTFPQLKVPILFETKVGPTWADCK